MQQKLKYFFYIQKKIENKFLFFLWWMFVDYIHILWIFWEREKNWWKYAQLNIYAFI